jgi:hypothetical protein
MNFIYQEGRNIKVERICECGRDNKLTNVEVGNIIGT